MNYPDVVMLALPRWDEKFSSTAFSLAKQLAMQTRVFYIDNPYTWKDVLASNRNPSVLKRIPALIWGRKWFCYPDPVQPNLVAVTPPVIFPINFLPHGAIYRLFARINNTLVKLCLTRVLRAYHIHNFIFVNSYNPFYLLDVENFKPRKKIYHCVDNISASKYVGKHGAYLEPEMIRKFDLTLTTSSKLTTYARQFTKSVCLLPNAADFDLFSSPANRPSTLSGLSKKVIGYIGSVDHRVDYNLLKSLAISLPDYTLLLVGPLSSEFEVSGLGNLKNVVTTGAKDIKELPNYLSVMDCAIIPFVCNELTSCIYPLKLNEYLAAGKPVVATPFSVDLNNFKTVILVAEAKAFVAAIELALKDRGVDAVLRRKEVAASNTWKSRVDEFWKLIDNK
ncbi:MAG: glycosyltransferase [Cyclobacteriaceae bacterium]|nr:glycosyltransferase [Cyclobacteriaceae bacterium]